MSLEVVAVVIFGARGTKKTSFITLASGVGKLSSESLGGHDDVTGTAFQLDGKNVILFDIPRLDVDSAVFLAESY
ncbi:unnamed protein product [Rhizoctonia solani]|uniref:G domain-containing protein n=1 Tax=Rhizoctonia solani TaxID=456999 RepID=A0A8H2X5F4_9AGAM|nr:unnamed protein product [Rhizoctonia solani]